jgi:cytochrome c553
MERNMKLAVNVLMGLSLLATSSQVLLAADKVAGEKKAAVCASCHGQKGIGNNAMYPNLAGQKPAYIVGQLKAFKTGTRKDPMMETTAKSLSDEDIKDIAAYFSGLENKTQHNIEKFTVKQATIEKAAMCKGCHGREGEGRGAFPRLRNQHYQYLATQLKAYKAGNRNGGPMTGIAKSLSKEDIKALSYYLSNIMLKK